jgi:hypothetical protein
MDKLGVDPPPMRKAKATERYSVANGMIYVPFVVAVITGEVQEPIILSVDAATEVEEACMSIDREGTEPW